MPPANRQTRFRFSVIIPLEFHRGQVETCLRRWSREQMYDRDQYEIIAVGCRASLNDEICAFFKSLLGSRDRLLLFDEPHDIALCAHGADEAQGEILFFTESHCLPEPDILQLTDETLAQHPEWSGFSCFSNPITHNPLSMVEAEMYNSDITYSMEQNSWRKVLDQCFAVWADAYHVSGGLRPQFGHFAEWLLSAQLHIKGYQIGYAPHIKINHYYSGEIRELLAFTTDFTKGEMTLHSDFQDDPCYPYFPAPEEWRLRYQSTDLSRTQLFHVLQNTSGLAARKEILQAASARASFIPPIPLVTAYARFWLAQTGMFFGWAFRVEKTRLHRLFVHLIDATVRLERARYMARWMKEQKQRQPSNCPSLTLEPHTADTFYGIGIYTLETWQGRPFRWLEPAGMLETSLIPGTYCLSLEWLPIEHVHDLTLYLNEQPLQIQAELHKATSQPFEIRSSKPVRLAWTCQRIAAPNDARLLGIPLLNLSIFPIKK